MFVIKHETTDEYWSNQWGWGPLDSCERFDGTYANLPIDGFWVKEALSDEDKQIYVRQGGTKCPYCNTNNIEAYDRNSDTGWIDENVQCHRCGNSWLDIYVLSSVKENQDSPA